MNTVRPRVLVVGVIMADVPALSGSITQALLASSNFEVTMRWASLGRHAAPNDVADYVAFVEPTPREKFALVNQLLEPDDLDVFDWVLVVDDDITIPSTWLDDYLALQSEAAIDFCQPARTAESDISHAFTTAQPGFDARATTFVEIGPVFSMNRRAATALLPFDESWPMGWGMEAAWRRTCHEDGISMGIIDAYPVGHSFRKTTAIYSYDQTKRLMEDKLRNEGLDDIQSHQALTRIFVGGRWSSEPVSVGPDLRLSVVVITRNRPTLVRRVLDSLADQSLRPGAYEVIVVDDGSDEPLDVTGIDTPSLRLFRQRPSGVAAARNLGLFASTGEVVLFIDDDDWVATDCLAAILAAHRHWPSIGDVVLGRTVLDESLRFDFLLSHATSGRGGEIFNYSTFAPHAELTWREFWGGRVSVKREFLMKNGIFNPVFDFGAEDIELASRLRIYGLRVFYEPTVLHVLFRKLTLSDLLQRSYKQGRALALFHRLHPHEEVFETTARDPRVPVNLDEFQLEEFVKGGLQIQSELDETGIEARGPFRELLDEALSGLSAIWFHRGFIEESL